VDVASAGFYTVTSRVAAGAGTGAFRIEVGGVNVSGTVSVPNTGGWQNWVDKISNVTLPDSGLQIIRIVIEAGDVNINHLEFVLDQVATNTPPEFTADPIVRANATEDSAYSATIAGSATDANPGDTLTYSKVSGPAWLSVAAGGALSGTPGNDDVGFNSWTVEVTDGTHSPVSATLEITVDNVNDAPYFDTDPVIMPNAVREIGYNGSLADSVTEIDAGDTVSYYKFSGPGWLNVAADGTLSGTPASWNVGLNSWIVQISDGNGGTDTATLEITVVNELTQPTLSIQMSGSDLQILWPSSVTGFSLYGTTNLSTNVVWSAVTNPPVIHQDDWMVTMPIEEAPSYFRLEAQ
jgi:hypothetical protein